MEDIGADNYLKCQELVQEFSEKNFSMLPRKHFCDILVIRIAGGERNQDQ